MIALWFMNLLLFSGHGDSSSMKTPTLVRSIGAVGQVATGSSHTIALSKDGLMVWTFGAGDNGEYILFFTLNLSFILGSWI